MITISLISVFPQLYEQFLQTSLIKSAQDADKVSINLFRFADFCPVKVPIDEPTVGHGPGMILKPELVEKAIAAAEEKSGPGYKIFFSPQGTPLSQPLLRKLASTKLNTPQAPSSSNSTAGHLILVCSRYEGMDRRVEDRLADQLLSIGDYVLLSGDSAATVFLEAFIRLIPGVVGNQQSIDEESFESPFLDHDAYGLPAIWQDRAVPDVLRSGNHGKIADWQRSNAITKTILRRFDWCRKYLRLSKDRSDTLKHIPPHYVVLMHDQVVTKNSQSGVTSVTSIDLHDIARSCTTYGIRKFFVVTPLKDQQEIVSTFLSFWSSPEGKTYNSTRSHSASLIHLASSFEQVKEEIEALTGETPLTIATGAKNRGHQKIIDYHSQGKVWQQNKPILIALGTGQGLNESFIESADYLLSPLNGLSNYNHLSVRSAAGIILDRWLGLNEVVESD